MGLFSKKVSGLMDVIRCDEPSYLIWKWHPNGTKSGNNYRENAIRWGSSLRVKDGEVAVFVYKQKDGTEQDFIEGPFDQILETANLPVLASLIGLVYDKGTPFQAEVYFINLAQNIQIRFGVIVSGIDINAIEFDKSSDGYRQLMSVTQDVTSATIKAETAAKVKDIADRQRIEVEHYGESLRIQREEAQYAQHKQTQTSNMGAFQVEKQAEVGIAGAEALGKMGTNGAGNIKFSGEGEGVNMAAMMASMAVGGAVGKNIADSMNSMMLGMNQSVQSSMTPPPVPEAEYYIAVKGQATGPFDICSLKKMRDSGQFTSESLVWKAGMTEWAKADTVDEMKSVFLEMPPIPN